MQDKKRLDKRRIECQYNAMNTYAANDTHGRNTIPGGVAIVTAKRVKEIKENRLRYPKPKNKYSDPYTYWHILDVVLSIRSGDIWKTGEVTKLLADRPITFDNITVGRVIRDISESLEMANGRRPISWNRWWDGARYWVSDEPEDRAAMEHLLDDLAILMDKDTDQYSPLRRCASLV